MRRACGVDSTERRPVDEVEARWPPGAKYFSCIESSSSWSSERVDVSGIVDAVVVGSLAAVGCGCGCCCNCG